MAPANHPTGQAIERLLLRYPELRATVLAFDAEAAQAFTEYSNWLSGERLTCDELMAAGYVAWGCHVRRARDGETNTKVDGAVPLQRVLVVRMADLEGAK